MVGEDGPEKGCISEADYERIHPKLVAQFRSLGANLEQARELAAEVFLQVCKSIGSFQRRSKLDTWVYSFAKTIWLNDLRHQRALKRSADVISLEELPGEIAEDLLPFEEQIDTRNFLDQVQTAISELPVEMRKAFVRRLEGNTHEEIAEELGVSAGRVASLVHQARTKLRHQFFPDGES